MCYGLILFAYLDENGIGIFIAGQANDYKIAFCHFINSELTRHLSLNAKIECLLPTAQLRIATRLQRISALSWMPFMILG